MRFNFFTKSCPFINERWIVIIIKKIGKFIFTVMNVKSTRKNRNKYKRKLISFSISFLFSLILKKKEKCQEKSKIKVRCG